MPHNSYQKLGVYSKAQKVTLDVPEANNGREIDARALLHCASKLNDAKDLLRADPKSKDKLKVYSEAVRKNQRLWTIFQVAVTDPENPLPESLKTTLFNLSLYVDKASFSAVGRYAPQVIDSLISINRIIAAGLSKVPPAGEVVPPPVDTRDIPTSLMTSA
ncbi:MAG: flagellar biosynthesis regulator FlaF [Alphaproteobacteria bacterium]|nr:flagellar biosynthesis regulator FlaF [Alphaproteobacteria bacterium]